MSKIIATVCDGQTREFWPEQYAAACKWFDTVQPQFADKGFTWFGTVLRHVSEVEASFLLLRPVHDAYRRYLPEATRLHWLPTHFGYRFLTAVALRPVGGPHSRCGSHLRIHRR